MATIAQPDLFSWKDVEELGDLARLKLVLDNMPDEKLMKHLEAKRGKGRNDYPVRAMWNSVLAGVVFQHKGAGSLLRELSRNAQLRQLCGFNIFSGAKAVPTPSAFSRFLTLLLKESTFVDEMFYELVNELKNVLPNFGKNLAGDGKAISSFGKKSKREDNPDRRSENDADWGKKTYRGKNKDGYSWEKVTSWFGFKLHLIVDANYEMPIAYELTPASVDEKSTFLELLEATRERDPELIEKSEYCMLDRGYDSTDLITTVWNKYHISPVVDIRNMWKDEKNQTRQLKTKVIHNVTYSYDGIVYCHCMETGEVRRMVYNGFEKDRKCQKFQCPAKYYGITCPYSKTCPVASGLRIPIEEDPRVFTPLARASHKWKELYKKRTSVERVNSRIETSFGFERHFLRGRSKMKLQCGICLCVMLSMALGRIRQNQSQNMRSLLKAA